MAPTCWRRQLVTIRHDVLSSGRDVTAGGHSERICEAATAAVSHTHSATAGSAQRRARAEQATAPGTGASLGCDSSSVMDGDRAALVSWDEIDGSTGGELMIAMGERQKAAHGRF